MGPLLQITTLRLRKVKRIIPSHTGCKWLEPAIRLFFFLSFSLFKPSSAFFGIDCNAAELKLYSNK